MGLQSGLVSTASGEPQKVTPQMVRPLFEVIMSQQVLGPLIESTLPFAQGQQSISAELWYFQCIVQAPRNPTAAHLHKRVSALTLQLSAALDDGAAATYLPWPLPGYEAEGHWLHPHLRRRW